MDISTPEQLLKASKKAADQENYQQAYDLASSGLGLMLEKLKPSKNRLKDKEHIHCGEPMTKIINSGKQSLAGWFCEVCRHWNPTIGREKQLPIAENAEVNHANQ